MHPDVQEILLDEEQIARRVAEMAAEISEDYAGREVTLVCVLTGAMPFTTDLLRRMQGDILLDSIAASSYGGASSSGEVKITKELKNDIAGRHVLLVDDVVDTGLTLCRLMEKLRARGPASLKSCVFLDKHSCRTVAFEPDYVGYGIPDAFVVGYGLDYREHYRHLPYVGVIRPEVVAREEALARRRAPAEQEKA